MISDRYYHFSNRSIGCENIIKIVEQPDKHVVTCKCEKSGKSRVYTIFEPNNYCLCIEDRFNDDQSINS